MEQIKKRDAKIDVIRLVACLLVIMQHISPAGERGNTLLVAIFSVDVPLFLLISGFLLFQGTSHKGLDHIWESYGGKLKKLVLHVFLPSCIIVAITAFLTPFFTADQPFSSLMNTENLNLVWVCIRNYVILQDTSSLYQIFWYIWVYVKIVISFPLLAFLCQNVKDKNYIRRFFILLAGINVILNDLQVMELWQGNFDSIVLDKYFLYILLGYEIYLLVEQLSWKQTLTHGLLLFASGVMGGNLIAGWIYRQQQMQYIPTATTIVASAGVFLVVYSVRAPKLAGIWNYLGKATLYVYMVHMLIIQTANKIWGDFFLELLDRGSNTVGLALHASVYGMIIFVISLGTGLIFKLLYENIVLFTVKKVASLIIGIGKGSNEQQEFDSNIGSKPKNDFELGKGRLKEEIRRV